MKCFTAILVIFLSYGYSNGLEDEFIGLPIEFEGDIWSPDERQWKEENWEETLERLCRNIDLTLNGEIVDCYNLEIIPKTLKTDRHAIHKREAEGADLEEGSGTEPMADEPSEAMPAESVPAESPLSGPPPAESLPSEATSAEPGLADPKPADLKPAEPTPAEPTPAEPMPTEPVPAEPVTAEPVSAKPALLPVPEEPVPAVPVPSEPVSAEPMPTDPVPTEPVTAEPVTAEPVTAEPVTAEPVTAEPMPTDPVPAEPVPTEPVPADPAPSEPLSSEPALAEPAPSGVTSAGPVPVDETAATTKKPERVKELETVENKESIDGKQGRVISTESLNDKQSGNAVVDGLGGTMEETDVALSKQKVNESLKNVVEEPKAGQSSEATKQAGTGSNKLLIALFVAVVTVGAAAFTYNYVRKKNRSKRDADTKSDVEEGKEMKPLMKNVEQKAHIEYNDEKEETVKA